uniref:phosphatidylinositol transfer protein alpha isoform n=1 Tax=Ciona intestinalis TaxID=7719 RepID=UPI000180BCD0|nr:phosphatidylinositol transfer protein alpha isoform [Ciona intestinalis]|eukprot:XP_002128690.1 phosphatidylinositol transfer protein alpha isoform [Ciona intestinalis]
MIIKEYRVILPMTVEEYQVAQLWSVAEASKNETGGGEGIEVLNNEPYTKTLENGTVESGQYTNKIYHFASRVPGFIRLFAPTGSLSAKEEAWNAYPSCRTEFTNPGYMKDNFQIVIQSYHADDVGESENVHNLTPKQLKDREVITIDIANDVVRSADYKPEFDPSKFTSQKAGRGPFGPNWIEHMRMQKQIYDNQEPGAGIQRPAVMCAYKLVTVKFKWLGFQNRIEKFIHNQERRLFTNFHRQVVCWMDNYHGLTMVDIRRIEDEIKKELDRIREQGCIRGTVVEDPDAKKT